MWQAPRDLNAGSTTPTSTDLPVPTSVGNRQKSYSAVLVGRKVADVERDLILETLEHCCGNRTHAAKMLGISIRTLRNKVGEYSSAGIQVPDRLLYNRQYDMRPSRATLRARTKNVRNEGDHVTLEGRDDACSPLLS
jgi:DNA-binding protein Fis